MWLTVDVFKWTDDDLVLDVRCRCRDLDQASTTKTDSRCPLDKRVMSAADAIRIGIDFMFMMFDGSNDEVLLCIPLPWHGDVGVGWWVAVCSTICGPDVVVADLSVRRRLCK